MSNIKNISTVVAKGLCLQCGSCVSICPKSCITLKRDWRWNFVPKIDEEDCVNCGLCLEVCPGYGVNFEELTCLPSLKRREKRNDYIGEYLAAFLGYSTEDRIRKRASSGGLIPALLLYLLETRKISGVLTVRSKDGEPFNPDVFIAQSPHEILESMQSKYHPVPLNVKLNDLERSKGKFAIVGLPCQIHGLRKYENIRKILEERIFLRIGLFCGLNLRFDSLDFFASKVREDLKDLKKVSYREGGWPGKMVLYFKNGNEHIFDKNIVNHVYTLQRCIYCIDHTNELADISCGDAWLPELRNKDRLGWSIVVSRSVRGNEILDELENKNKLFLQKIDVGEVIRSQSGMLIFKKENSWIRFRLGRIFKKPLPKYDEISLDRLHKISKISYLIGNVILNFIIFIMSYKSIRDIIKKIPLPILNAYEILIVQLLYRDKPFISRIWGKLAGKMSDR